MQKSEVKPMLSIMSMWLRLNLLRTFTLVLEPFSYLVIAFIMDNSSATRVFFLIWFFAATFSFCKVKSNISCNEKEKQALLNLKRGLTDPWNALSSWSGQEDCCKWAGVHCDNKTARVRKLQLGNLSLNGEISHSLLELEHLNYLDLSISNFNCTPIPSFLSSMRSMRHLNLASAGFCGLIPQQLGNLSDLRYLNLGYNFGLYVHSLHWMSSLSSLKYLDMSSVNLSSALDWLQIMSRLSSLSELYLQSCHLDSLNPSFGFVNFTSLLVLDLSVNLFIHEIPNWFSNISSTLLELDLSSNALKGEIPCSVSNFQNLEHLVLGVNYLTGKIPESFGQLKHLKVLDLNLNSFTGPIPSSLGNLSYMWKLILEGNRLNGTLPKSLGLLSNLKHLSIGNNSLTGTVDEEFFTKLSKLKYLDLSRTPLFFNVNSNWVPPFQLIYAHMSSCKVGPNFPAWLQTQRSLKVLLMSMSGISDKAPSWFWNWTSNIDFVNLSANNIEGDVPNFLVNSAVLDLSSNHLKGQLPRLSANVIVLDVANNLFSGPISTFLCQKTNRKNKLQVLDASNNLFLGELSHCWRYWQYLIHLNLGSNRLSSKIPYSMGSLVALKALRLPNNSIYGDIPSSLQKCSNLGLLDIGENHLSMTIPLWIGEMKSLIILRLRSNGFKGHIPLQTCQLSSLRILDLANNSLSGPIPKCLNSINSMAMPHIENYETIEYFEDAGTYFESLMLVPKGEELRYEENLEFVSIIDLSSNNLSGSIPNEISVLSQLHFLNLSRNHLTGRIPEKIGTMKELESIDLSRNHLSGEIPPSMSNLTFLSYLDLSYNNFSGRIPSSTQLQSFDALRYTGNPELCGAPLKTNCRKEQESDGDTPVGKAEDDSETSWFYSGLGVGFAVGFWGVCAAPFFKNTRTSFWFVNDMNDQTM